MTPDAPGALPTAADVHAAAARLADHAIRTPVLRSDILDRELGMSLFFKAENVQRTGSFKFRGAFNAIASLDPVVRTRGVVAYSSGNHAQAIALAAALHGISATVVMPSDAPTAKVIPTRAHGANIIEYDRYTEDRTTIAESYAARHGSTLIPPFDSPAVISGQGTAALELVHDVPDLDTIVVPVGGGGLIAGSALAAQAVIPRIRAVGVEPAAGNDTALSFASGTRVRIPVPRTIADGLAAEQPGELTFALNRRRVDRILTVTDDDIRTAMRTIFEYLHIVVEPSGAVAAAAVCNDPSAFGRRVGIILSGGNIDVRRFQTLCAAGPEA